ncbi:thioredoxin family protein [Shewanella psychrotolerans]|uniref:thioredoxin family protein n=1 Tax=Shewanella psychrotolerans TaxID=2864206 RepID=UPI001C65EA69|nr:thioredoxin family protein [Shewanella psychrotolerans]QYK00766.1 thioredoxin family protein [Shewanella psychrotolerans]
MNTILLVSGMTLTVLVLLIIFLGFKKAKGSQIPLAVLLLLVCFTAMNAAVTYFIYPKEDINAYKSLVWQSLIQEQIAPLVAQDKTVFVDVSADWCNICKGNKDGVLHREAVVNLLQRDNMVLMRGDLTHSNAKIEAFLADYNAFGVPFNVIYSPSHPNGIVLPRVLDYQQVISLLDSN